MSTDPRFVRFFHSSVTQYTEEEVASFVKQYCRKGTKHLILIGGDEGWGKEFWATMTATKGRPVRKHVYIMGPGMWSFDDCERKSIKDMAKSCGIDIESPDWHKRWKNGVWKQHVFKKFKFYGKRTKGSWYSIEVDNLDEVLRSKEDYIDFYHQLDNYRKKHGIKTKLMIKNLRPGYLLAVKTAIKEGKIRREMFASFAMFEKRSGNADRQMAICQSMGITAVTSKTGIQATDAYETRRSGVKWAEGWVR